MRPTRGWIRAVIAIGSYPVLLVSGVGAMSFALARWPGGRLYETLLVSVVLLAVTVALLVLQRISPAQPSWRNWRRDWPTDLAHGVFSAVAGTAGSRVLLFGAVAALSATTGRWALGWWPSHWPLLAQLPLALVLSDLGMYALHRASHAIPWLWRIHAVHHSSERLYTLSSGRVHPIYVGLAVLAATGPILLLGAPPPLFALLSTAVGINGLLQHSNVDLDCRPWRWLLATADAHRWHHSADPSDGNTNFGNTLSCWDRLFWTWRTPVDMPARIGLADEAYPQHFIGQVIAPFVRG